eukprot:62033-Chlamydomonas_euryale.AAC.1
MAKITKLNQRRKGYVATVTSAPSAFTTGMTSRRAWNAFHAVEYNQPKAGLTGPTPLTGSSLLK